jgi:hypothetical protein
LNSGIENEFCSLEMVKNRAAISENQRPRQRPSLLAGSKCFAKFLHAMSLGSGSSPTFAHVAVL